MVSTKFFKNAGPFSVSEIAEFANCEVKGDGSQMILNISTLEAADKGELSFYSNYKYAQDFKNTEASVVIASPKDAELAPKGVTILLCNNPYETYAKVAAKFYPPQIPQASIAKTAVISASAKIGEGCFVGDCAVIGQNVIIGDGVVVASHAHICDNVVVGKNTHIKSHVTLSHCEIGSDCIIHPGVRIGQDGFGFAPSAAGILKVEQLGIVKIGNHVEIGANTCIDRGALENTEVGDGTKIDNLVQIGHGVKIGKHSFIVAQTGIAGSTKVGNGVTIAGQAGIAGHITIGDGATIAGQSGVGKDVEPKATIGGTPAVPILQFHRMSAYLKKITSRDRK